VSCKRAGVFLALGHGFHRSVARLYTLKGEWLMNQQTILVELILGGFFAVACMRTSVPEAPGGKLHFGDLLRLPGRIERLRRSRWQWFSMVALLLVIRMQRGMPFVLEITVALMFLLFLAIPTRATVKVGARG
jgi:hypothetical protein